MSMSMPLPVTCLKLKRGEASDAFTAWGAILYDLVEYHCH